MHSTRTNKQKKQFLIPFLYEMYNFNFLFQTIIYLLSLTVHYDREECFGMFI